MEIFLLASAELLLHACICQSINPKITYSILFSHSFALTMVALILALPADIRLNIYTYAIVDSTVAIFLKPFPRSMRHRPFVHNSGKERLIPSSFEPKQQLRSQSYVISNLRVCKQIHHEVTHILYSHVAITLRCDFARPATDVNNHASLTQSMLRVDSMR